jgi:microcystin-dependent protein
MSDQFIAEIRIFPFNFAPNGWAMCDGQILPISQNTALFSLLGTTYGGDGKNNFGLPNIQGRSVMHPGQMPGSGIVHNLGEMAGSETVSLQLSEIPSHNHNVGAQTVPLGSVATPAGNVLTRPASGNLYTAPNTQMVTMSPSALGPAGGDLPHNNMQPYLTLNFCIALQGIFPARP